MRKSILGMVLAGGEGTRLAPLTQERAKPAVPFGGKYRIIDFVLSNFINSEIDSVYVLTQFRSQSLSEHINRAWNIASPLTKQFVTPVPAQMRNDKKRWYDGTADAIWQNLHLVEDHNPDMLAVFGGDHIYKMDISQMADFHSEKDALATVAAIPVPIEEGSEFGIIEVDSNGLIIGFQEKPKNPKPMPGRPGYCLASMGNYIFDKEWICKTLNDDAGNDCSSHDFGKDILVDAVSTDRLYAYDFKMNDIPGQEGMEAPYWKDVGTLKSYYKANMDLRSIVPKLDLYCEEWPIHTINQPLPPAKFVHSRGRAIESIICDGCIVSDSVVRSSILSPRVRVDNGSTVSDSIIMSNTAIGRSCIIKNAIIDKNCVIQSGTVIGFNREDDEKNFKVVDLDEDAGTWLTIVDRDFKFKDDMPSLN